jgi:subtilisin-like proprotein convertase family protein
MTSQTTNASRRWRIAAVALATGAAGLAAATAAAPADATSSWSTISGTGMGAVPDGDAACLSFAAPLVVTFTVAGLPTGRLSGVRVSDLVMTHTYVGDLQVKLTAPDASSVDLFTRTGSDPLSPSTTPGDSSNLAGSYTFSDTSTPNDWWATAAALDASQTIPAGRYNATTPGATTGPGVRQSITSAFAGVTDPNGMWTLSFADHCQSDTGMVTSVKLQLQPSSAGPVACAVFQSASDLAAGNVQDSAFDVAGAQTTVETAADAVGAARTSKASATEKVTSAQASAATAATALTTAKAATTKTSAALKKAKKSHNKAKIAKAKKALKAAKSKQAAAQKASTTAQTAATAAGEALTTATQALVDRQLELTTAKGASSSVQSALLAAEEIYQDKQTQLAQCLDA